MPKPEPRSAPTGVAPDPRVRAAWLYHVEGLTQENVARAMKVSRARVIRLLAAARDAGVVRIRIDAKGTDQIELERRLCRELRLDEALVVPSPAERASTAAVVGHAAGIYLADRIEDGMSIGVGWGSTLSMSVKAIGTRSCRGVSVISLLGAMTHSRAINPSAVARRMADLLGADCYQLTAPVFVASERTRAALWKEPGLRELLARARRADLALVSVGDLASDATLFREGLLPRPLRSSLVAAGSVGDVLCHFLDRRGRSVDHPVNRRVIAVGLEDLRRVSRIVIAAGGARKVAAIRAALAATGARVLITDEAAARGLLSPAEPKPPR